jgi:hypothetical protein
VLVDASFIMDSSGPQPVAGRSEEEQIWEVDGSTITALQPRIRVAGRQDIPLAKRDLQSVECADGRWR